MEVAADRQRKSKTPQYPGKVGKEKKEEDDSGSQDAAFV